MPKILDQERINALLRIARQGSGAVDASSEPVVHPWDAHQTRKIGQEQLNSINQMHELFARNLGHSLAAYLRSSFECCLVSAEYLSYSEYLASLPAVTYLASCDLSPVGAGAVLQIDLAIAFSIIELMLGGEDGSAPPAREVSEIEEQILDGIMRIICRELQNTWQVISLEFRFKQRYPVLQAHRLMPPDERNLCLSFELKIGETRGTLTVSVPDMVSNTLLRKITLAHAVRRGLSDTTASSLVREKLQRCPFPVELVVSGLRIPAQSLADMRTGTILPFSLNVSSPATLVVGNVPLCAAMPVRVNARRAARVLTLENSAV